MEQEWEKRLAEASQNPQNLGALKDADAVGSVGNPECGEMLRLWIKYREEKGKKVIDRATFQSFGCETAIAVASLATQMIRGKTAEEALALKGEALAGQLGPLPPMKIHCAELVEGALRSALQPGQGNESTVSTGAEPNRNLQDQLTRSRDETAGKKVVFLDETT